MNAPPNRYLALASLMLLCLLGLVRTVPTEAAAATTAATAPATTAVTTPATTAETTKVAANGKPTVILVHGAFADATGWQKLIPLLTKADYPVLAVQNPLISLADDVATTKRLIDAQPGPVILVGHSYGGAVITGAAVDSPNVVALVYIAAFAPDAGEPLAALTEQFDPSGLGAALVPDAAGYLTIAPTQFRDVFAGDITPAKAAVMAVTQKPVNSATFGATLDAAAWHTIPAWYMVATEDRTINPDLERFYAERMGATTVEIESSHVAFISHPTAAFKLIESAARATEDHLIYLPFTESGVVVAGRE